MNPPSYRLGALVIEDNPCGVLSHAPVGGIFDVTAESSFPRVPLRPYPVPGRRRDSTDGFSLIEVTVVLVLAAVLLTLAASAFAGYQSRSSAQRAAQVFSRDLALARASARRLREPVAIRFYETSMWYTVTMEGGQELVRRRFASGSEIVLSVVDLEISGDSLRFDAGGVAALPATTGTALFQAGSSQWEVEFNALGAARVAER